ncbi:MAG: exodeoxyribonuclease VII small subunit [Parvularculaceae bacterium]|nr:MAG: exodeoxyribonuclease VII small subunit [Parvularculaceae bacterium]
MAKETSKSPSADLSAMSFETALAELEDIIQKLETGGVELEKSIELYERGAALRAHCETKLRAAQERIEQIVATGEDAPKAAPAAFE